MQVLVLNSSELRKLLDLDELRMEMKKALISSSVNREQNSQRTVLPLGEENLLGIMPAQNPSLRLRGYKVVSVFSKNSALGINPHQGFITLLDYDSGKIKCLLEGSSITALRTAAVSAMATDALSRKNSASLGIIGAGQQAIEHIRAIAKVRSIREVFIFNRSKSRAEQLVELLGKDPDISFVLASTPQEAVKNADIVVTCTASKEILLKISELKPGTHINAVGSCRPGYREVELLPHKNLKVFLDNREACSLEADEIPDSNQTEIGEVFAGLEAGRKNDDEITFFKSVGLGIEDLFAANLAYNKALEAGLGVHVNFS